MAIQEGMRLTGNSSHQRVAALEQLRAIRRQEFRGSTRGRGSEISDKVGDREINLMPHRTHHRHAGGGNRASHHLLVKFPEILQTSTTASHHDHIHRADLARAPCAIRELRDGGGDLCGCPLPLHPHRTDHDTKPRIPAVKHMEEVMNSGPGG